MKRLELVGKKKFAASAFELNDETFIVYLDFLTSSDLGLEIYLF